MHFSPHLEGCTVFSVCAIIGNMCPTGPMSYKGVLVIRMCHEKVMLMDQFSICKTCSRKNFSAYMLEGIIINGEISVEVLDLLC